MARGNNSKDILTLCRNMVDYNVRFYVPDQAREILSYAICVLLSIEDERIQEIVMDKIPNILQKLNIYIGNKEAIQENRKEITYDNRTSRIPLDRKYSFSNDVSVDRYVDYTGTQDYLTRSEARSLYITIDEESDYYNIIKQVALELLHLIRHHTNYNIHTFGVESGLSTITVDTISGQMGSSYRRHIEEYLSLWYIEKAMNNCKETLSGDCFFKAICENSESKEKVLDVRVEDVLEKLDDNDVFNKLFVFVFDKKNDSNNLGRRYCNIFPEVMQRLDSLDGQLRMIQEYSLDEETKDELYQRCLDCLNDRFTYFDGYKMYTYK